MLSRSKGNSKGKGKCNKNTNNSSSSNSNLQPVSDWSEEWQTSDTVLSAPRDLSNDPLRQHGRSRGQRDECTMTHAGVDSIPDPASLPGTSTIITTTITTTISHRSSNTSSKTGGKSATDNITMSSAATPPPPSRKSIFDDLIRARLTATFRGARGGKSNVLPSQMAVEEEEEAEKRALVHSETQQEQMGNITKRRKVQMPSDGQRRAEPIPASGNAAEELPLSTTMSAPPMMTEMMTDTVPFYVQSDEDGRMSDEASTFDTKGLPIPIVEQSNLVNSFNSDILLQWLQKRTAYRELRTEDSPLQTLSHEKVTENDNSAIAEDIICKYELVFREHELAEQSATATSLTLPGPTASGLSSFQETSSAEETVVQPSIVSNESFARQEYEEMPDGCITPNYLEENVDTTQIDNSSATEDIPDLVVADLLLGLCHYRSDPESTNVTSEEKMWPEKDTAEKPSRLLRENQQIVLKMPSQMVKDHTCAWYTVEDLRSLVCAGPVNADTLLSRKEFTELMLSLQKKLIWKEGKVVDEAICNILKKLSTHQSTCFKEIKQGAGTTSPVPTMTDDSQSKKLEDNLIVSAMGILLTSSSILLILYGLNGVPVARDTSKARSSILLSMEQLEHILDRAIHFLHQYVRSANVLREHMQAARTNLSIKVGMAIHKQLGYWRDEQVSSNKSLHEIVHDERDTHADKSKTLKSALNQLTRLLCV